MNFCRVLFIPVFTDSANVTDASAISVHGTNPQNLIEKILRSKIYNHAFWKEHCFGLTAESLVDKAMEIEAVGGTFGGVKEPTRFIQLMLKMLQIQPEKEIVVEFIKNEDYKYVRALGAFYMRLTGRPVEVYQYLEPLYNDYRKLRRRNADGTYTITRMDEFIEECLREDYLLDIALPHLPSRVKLEQSGQLAGPRRSALEDELDELEQAEAEEEAAAKAKAEAEAKEAAKAEAKAAAERARDEHAVGGRRADGARDGRERERFSSGIPPPPPPGGGGGGGGGDDSVRGRGRRDEGHGDGGRERRRREDDERSRRDAHGDGRDRRDEGRSGGRRRSPERRSDSRERDYRGGDRRGGGGGGDRRDNGGGGGDRRGGGGDRRGGGGDRRGGGRGDRRDGIGDRRGQRSPSDDSRSYSSSYSYSSRSCSRSRGRSGSRSPRRR